MRAIEYLKKYWQQLLVPFALLVWNPFDLGVRAEWIEKWGVLALAVGLVYLSRLPFMLSWKLTLGYVWVRACQGAFFWVNVVPAELTPLIRTHAMEQLTLLAVFLGFLGLRMDITRGIRSAARLMLLAVFVSPHPSKEVWLMHNPSMAGTFVALVLGPVSILAVILTHSWTALGVCVVRGVWAIRWRFPILFVWALSALISGLGGYAMIHFHNGRFIQWSDYLRHWWEQGWSAVVFGSGPGSGGVYLPYIGFSRPGHWKEVALYAHNDYLQLLCETGVIGATLATLATLSLWKRATPAERGTLLGLGVAMLSNYPMHWAITALIGWNLVLRTTGSIRSDRRFGQQ